MVQIAQAISSLAQRQQQADAAKQQRLQSSRQLASKSAQLPQQALVKEIGGLFGGKKRREFSQNLQNQALQLQIQGQQLNLETSREKLDQARQDRSLSLIGAMDSQIAALEEDVRSRPGGAGSDLAMTLAKQRFDLLEEQTSLLKGIPKLFPEGSAIGDRQRQGFVDRGLLPPEQQFLQAIQGPTFAERKASAGARGAEAQATTAEVGAEAAPELTRLGIEQKKQELLDAAARRKLTDLEIEDFNANASLREKQRLAVLQTTQFEAEQTEVERGKLSISANLNRVNEALSDSGVQFDQDFDEETGAFKGLKFAGALDIESNPFGLTLAMKNMSEFIDSEPGFLHQAKANILPLLRTEIGKLKETGNLDPDLQDPDSRQSVINLYGKPGGPDDVEVVSLLSAAQDLHRKADDPNFRFRFPTERESVDQFEDALDETPFSDHARTKDIFLMLERSTPDTVKLGRGLSRRLRVTLVDNAKKLTSRESAESVARLLQQMEIEDRDTVISEVQRKLPSFRGFEALFGELSEQANERSQGGR